jgi:hypothetical protein
MQENNQARRYKRADATAASALAGFSKQLKAIATPILPR